MIDHDHDHGGETRETSRHEPWRGAAVPRLLWTILSAFVVESAVIGMALLPAVVFFDWHLGRSISPAPLRLFLLGAAIVPSYIIFSLLLMFGSAISTRLLGWRTPPNAEMRIADLSWDLCNWARYAISTHIVKVLAGALFRSTPPWTWYLRLNGARIGRRVWINSLEVADHCLLEFGSDVVIGSGAHVSGHTVERGVVRTAPVRFGPGTTVGLGSHVEIDVTTGAGCRIGSLSMVPESSRLAAETTYVGAPVHAVVPHHE